jgi:beta-phosphoglucomutase
MWYNSFQLVMFDFDGVLVDSERAHYNAYKQMCAKHGVNLPWDFVTYCSHAHYSSDSLQKALYREYPTLHEQAPEWSTLYREKTAFLEELYNTGKVGLQPGVTALLEELQENGVQRCVVTHSAGPLVALLRKQHPILNTIPHWITRESYNRPKPASDCYQLAIERLLPPGGRAIGFEDTPRGITALLGSDAAAAVLIAHCPYPEITQLQTLGVHVVPCLSQLSALNSPSCDIMLGRYATSRE